jgi:hypothetical protein
VSERYPAIGSLSAIGDGHSLALMDGGGGVQWYCPLRFDADPLIWSLLDAARGGALRIGPAGPANVTRSYVEGTAVLAYEWQTGTGRLAVRVGMVFPNRGGQDLVWVLDGLDGEVEIEVVLDPRPSFGRHEADLHPGPSETQVIAEENLRLTFAGPVELRQLAPGMRQTLTFRAGGRMAFCLHTEVGASAGLAVASQEELAAALDDTVAAWWDWQSVIVYDGPARDAVLRSAITLKLLIYEPSGAVVAAGTTSLPEEIGGVRNWDYRYTWLRDASFTRNALYQLGCRREANRYARWMCDVTAAHGLPLRVLYGMGGETEFPEYERDDLEGYRGSRPVRVGNGAEYQLQLDSYGELLDCLSICEVLGEEVMRREWPHFRSLVDFVADHWRDPDSGIWEVRDRRSTSSTPRPWPGPPWTGAATWSRHAGLPVTSSARGPRPTGCATRSSPGAWSTARFGRAYGNADLDASLLVLPVVGFIEGDDPLMTATIDAIERDLTPEGAVARGLLYRYRAEVGDGLSGQEGAFAICGFWLVEALALAGRHEDAEAVFEGPCRLAGDAGLFAEEIDPLTGEQLGNTPQAFTHIGLINAGLRLAHHTAKGARRAGPVTLRPPASGRRFEADAP